MHVFSEPHVFPATQPTVSKHWKKHNTQQPFYGPLSGTTRVSLYQKKHSPTHHP